MVHRVPCVQREQHQVRLGIIEGMTLFVIFLIRPYLLESTSKEVREDFCGILGHGLQYYCTYKGVEVH